MDCDSPIAPHINVESTSERFMALKYLRANEHALR